MSKEQLNEMKKFMQVMEGEDFPAQGSEQECAWWAGCTNDATTTEPHPVLGDVPICDRCVAKIRKIEGLDEETNDNWGVGDFVVTTWEDRDKYSEPLKVTGVYGDQVRVVDDYGNSELMSPEDLRLAPNEVSEDENDARGKMCPVCSGGRREGYGKDCPNCGGEGYVTEDEADGMGHYDVAIEYPDKRYDDVINAEPEALDQAIETAQEYIEWVEKGMMNAEITSKREDKGDEVRFKIYSLDKLDNSMEELINVVVRPADPADYIEDDVCLESVVDDLLDGNPLRKAIKEFNDQREVEETSTNLPKGFEVVDEEDEFIEDDDDLDNLSINVELDD